MNHLLYNQDTQNENQQSWSVVNSNKYNYLPSLHEPFSAHEALKKLCLWVENQRKPSVQIFYHTNNESNVQRYEYKKPNDVFSLWIVVCLFFISQLPFISFNLVKSRSKLSTSASPAVRLASS